MLVRGMPTTKALNETVRLAESSDTIFVTKYDYNDLAQVPELKPLLENGERLHDGKHFLLLRPRARPSVP